MNGIKKITGIFAVVLVALFVGNAYGQSLDNPGQNPDWHHRNPQPGAVYVTTNQPTGNDVVVYSRAVDGKLTPLQTISTGGTGTKAPTESQDAVALSEDHRLLFTVNVASNDITVFSVDLPTYKLTFVQRMSSGGDRPVSLAVRGNLLYVVNSGLHSGISGFRIGDDGTLTPIEGSIRPLSFGDNSPFGDVTLPCTSIFPAFEAGVTCSAAQPADIRFTPNGKFLIVSERLVNQFSVYALDDNGVAGDRESRTSSGESPFGIDFDRRGHMLVAESFLDSPGTGKSGNGAASSYYLTRDGATRIITGSLKTGQRTGCWVAITPDGRYAYVTNPGAASISEFRIQGNGGLRLINAIAALSFDPRDEGITPDGRYLYVLNNTGGSVNGYGINRDGSLYQASTTGQGGLPLFSLGLAAF